MSLASASGCLLQAPDSMLRARPKMKEVASLMHSIKKKGKTYEHEEKQDMLDEASIMIGVSSSHNVYPAPTIPSHHNIKAVASKATNPTIVLEKLLRLPAPPAGGAAVVVALGGGCVDLGPVGVSILDVALPDAVIRELRLLALDPGAKDVAVEKVVPPATLTPDASLDAALDAALDADEASLERDEMPEDTLLVKEEMWLDADEDSPERDDATEDRTLDAEEAAEENRLVGAGMMV